MRYRRFHKTILSMLGAGLLVSVPVWAGSPHFISCNVSISGDQVCVTGKEAGLGDEDQVNVNLQVVAHCQNPGNNDPSAQNKETFEAAGTFPVQNGKALYELCVTTDFQPDCDPPMHTILDTVAVFDATNGIACTVSLN